MLLLPLPVAVPCVAFQLLPILFMEKANAKMFVLLFVVLYFFLLHFEIEFLNSANIVSQLSLFVVGVVGVVV